MSRASEAKKQVSVLAACTSTTNTRKKTLEHVSYIYYLVQFKKNKAPVQALIDLESEVNAIHLSFANQLGLPIRPTDVGAQKIDGTMLDTHGIVVVALSVVDKANWVKFFEETFFVANVSLEVVFRIFFLTLNDADIKFLGWDL